MNFYTYFLFAVFLCLKFLSANAQHEPAHLKLVYGDSTQQIQRQQLTFSGSILHHTNGDPIANASILIQENNQIFTSNKDGSYRINLAAGKYTLRIAATGFQEIKLILYLYANGTHNQSLTEVIYNLEEVSLTDERENDNIRSARGSVEQLSIEKIGRQSQFLGEVDVLRSLQSLSGVSSVGEGASGFNVRGGNTDENLIFQDGNLIINPVHALGFFSLFHPDMVQDITLYKGDVPAEYGGRLSSVLDIRLREGNSERFAAQGGLGIASSRLAIEGPIVKDKASFILGGRASYFDWILKRVDDIDLRKSKAFFYDLTGKIDARITPSTKVGISLFNSQDDFQFGDNVKIDYATQTGSAYINQLIGKKLIFNGLFNIGQYNSSLFDIEGNNQSQFDISINYMRGNASLRYQISPQANLTLGAEQTHYKISPGSLSPLNDQSLIEADQLADEKGIETAFFVQQQLEIGSKLELIAGLRYTLYRNIGADEVFLYEEGMRKTEASIIGSQQFQEDEEIVRYTGLEPKLSVRFSMNEKHSIKLGYSRAYQYFSQISNTASATPIDIWQLSNYHIEPQKADNYSIGYYRNFRQNSIKTQLVAFYRDIHQLIEYRDFAELLLNEHIETELIRGVGRAYGLEFAFQKDYGKHRFEGNYTFSRSLRKVEATSTQEGVNAGEWYASNFDRPHIFNLNYILALSPKQNFSVNFTYSTGRPTTAPVSSYTNGNIVNIPIYSNRNQFRIPDFHRLDVAYTIGPWGKVENREYSLTFSVYNLYGRKNAFSVYFRQDPSQKVTAYRIAVLGTFFPAATFNFKF